MPLTSRNSPEKSEMLGGVGIVASMVESLETHNAC